VVLRPADTLAGPVVTTSTKALAVALPPVKHRPARCAQYVYTRDTKGFAIYQPKLCGSSWASGASPAEEWQALWQHCSH